MRKEDLFIVPYVTYWGFHNLSVPMKTSVRGEISPQESSPILLPLAYSPKLKLSVTGPISTTESETASFQQVGFVWYCDKARQLRCDRQIMVIDAVGKCVPAVPLKFTIKSPCVGKIIHSLTLWSGVAQSHSCFVTLNP